MKEVISAHRLILELGENLDYCSCREWSLVPGGLEEADKGHAKHVETMLRDHLHARMGDARQRIEELLANADPGSWDRVERADEPGLWDIGIKTNGIMDMEDLVAEAVPTVFAEFLTEIGPIFDTLLTVLDPGDDDHF